MKSESGFSLAIASQPFCLKSLLLALKKFFLGKIPKHDEGGGQSPKFPKCCLKKPVLCL